MSHLAPPRQPRAGRPAAVLALAPEQIPRQGSAQAWPWSRPLRLWLWLPGQLQGHFAKLPIPQSHLHPYTPATHPFLPLSASPNC